MGKFCARGLYTMRGAMRGVMRPPPTSWRGAGMCAFVVVRDGQNMTLENPVEFPVTTLGKLSKKSLAGKDRQDPVCGASGKRLSMA